MWRTPATECWYSFYRMGCVSQRASARQKWNFRRGWDSNRNLLIDSPACLSPLSRLSPLSQLSPLALLLYCYRGKVSRRKLRLVALPLEVDYILLWADIINILWIFIRYAFFYIYVFILPSTGLLTTVNNPRCGCGYLSVRAGCSTIRQQDVTSACQHGHVSSTASVKNYVLCIVTNLLLHTVCNIHSISLLHIWHLNVALLLTMTIVEHFTLVNT